MIWLCLLRNVSMYLLTIHAHIHCMGKIILQIDKSAFAFETFITLDLCDRTQWRLAMEISLEPACGERRSLTMNADSQCNRLYRSTACAIWWRKWRGNGEIWNDFSVADLVKNEFRHIRTTFLGEGFRYVTSTEWSEVVSWEISLTSPVLMEFQLKFNGTLYALNRNYRFPNSASQHQIKSARLNIEKCFNRL